MNSTHYPVEYILARSAASWRVVADDITALVIALRKAVGEDAYRGLVPDLDERVGSLRAAATRFEAAATRPEVVIATTGTTSSGKSTLANLLIGDLLLPKAVQEMSAGVVTIRHDQDIRRLKVEHTDGATWATGTWDSISTEDVCARLESTMQAYRMLLAQGNAGAGVSVEPPRMEITWPTRIGRDANSFGLPVGAKLTVVDLPGLKYINDEANGRVLRQQARKALCLVAYNAFETDSLKQEALLRQVVDQVKALGGSPARMLFVLNRIDAFRTDRDPTASEREFCERITRQIRTGIREALVEYADVADSISPLSLSSEPALYTVMAANRIGAQQTGLLEQLEDEYKTLFPRKEMKALPRAPDDWTDAQRHWFLEEARKQSRLDMFEGRLRAHVAEHLPEILLPDLVDGVLQPAQAVLQGVDALMGAYGLHEREQVAQAKKDLENLNQRLRALQKEALTPLNPLREVAVDAGDLQEKLFGVVPGVEAAIGLAGPDGGPGRLSPLYHALGDAVRIPLQRLNDYVYRLMSGEAVEDTLIEASGSAAPLRTSIQTLRSSPYERAWRQKEGTRFQGAEGEQVSAALAAFAGQLSVTATQMIAQESVVQADRMKAALQACGEAVVERLEGTALQELERSGFQGLQGVFRGTFDTRAPRLPAVRFPADMRQWSHSETKTVQENYLVEKRIWYKPWKKRFVTESRPVLRTFMSQGIEVDPLGTLLDGFTSSAAVVELEAFFVRWVCDAIADFERELELRLKSGVRTYRLALEQRGDEIERGAEIRIEGVEHHRAALNKAQADVERSRQWRANVEI